MLDVETMRRFPNMFPQEQKRLLLIEEPMYSSGAVAVNKQ
jgi:hypothetical protein